MKTALLAALAACALLGAGCLTDDVRQAYPGAPLPADETCALVVPSMLDVRAIDGVAMDWSLRVKKGKQQTLRLVPGNHRLLVRYYDPTADESRREIYEVDRIEVPLDANPQSVHEMKYDTWTRNMEMRKAGEKVRVWVVQVAPGVPRAALAPAAPAAATAPAAGRIEAMKGNWNTLAPAEREAFLKWLLAQP